MKRFYKRNKSTEQELENLLRCREQEVFKTLPENSEVRDGVFLMLMEIVF